MWPDGKQTGDGCRCADGHVASAAPRGMATRAPRVTTEARSRPAGAWRCLANAGADPWRAGSIDAAGAYPTCRSIGAEQHRSEEHTSELQYAQLVCRLLL